MSEMDFEGMRRAMVAGQLRTVGVDDPAVIAAMASVAREQFLPPERARLAYAEVSAPIAPGRAMSPPMATGLLLNRLAPRSGERGLVVGAGTGYSAAVLARLAGPLIALEEDEVLAAKARATLAGSDVEVVSGPLAAGWPAGAPYDFILLDGAVEVVPAALIEQLADGGRMTAALVEKGVTRLAAGRRSGAGFALIPFADAEAAPLPGFALPRTFGF